MSDDVCAAMVRLKYYFGETFIGSDADYCTLPQGHTGNHYAAFDPFGLERHEPITWPNEADK